MAPALTEPSNSVEDDIQSIKELAAKLCQTHNLSFIGFFQNASHTFEKVVTEGIEGTTPNGSFSSTSFNNISNNSEIQHLISNIVNSSTYNHNHDDQKSSNNSMAMRAAATSSPNHSLNLSTSSSVSNTSNFGSLSSNASSITSGNYKYLQINPHDKVDVKNYLYNCFEEFQQIPCKLLAKAWIKVIEPKKQSKYPYKLGNSSKPYWWPGNCIHREPDHLKKDERINLLINILRIFKQKREELIYAASLIQGLGPSNNSSSILSSKPDFGHRKMEIMRDMFKVVNSQNTLSTTNIKVIKPGKKYSSSIYNRARTSPNVPKLKPTPSKENIPNDSCSTSKLNSILSTPPSMESLPKQPRNNHIHLPPIGNTSESYYGDLMEYIINKPDPQNSQIGGPKHHSLHSGLHSALSSNNISGLLQSPYVPSETKYVKQVSDLRTPPATIRLNTNNSDGVPSESSEDEVGSSTQLNAELSLQQSAKSKTPLTSTPPTGIFRTFANPSSKMLTALSPSRINSMNKQISDASKRPKRFVFNNTTSNAMKVSKRAETPPSQIKIQLERVLSSRNYADVEMDNGEFP